MSDADFDLRQVVPHDAIPSVDDPQGVPVAAYEGEPDDDVVAVAVKGRARAYPVRYLHYHEIVNDELGGVPVAVTWCPLCGSAVVYDRRAETVDAEGADLDDEGGLPETLTFGVSGKLADDDLVMYDGETGTEWKQSLGRALSGLLAGASLRVLPAGVTTMARFREAHPDGDVLAPPGGESEAAGDGDDPEPVDYDEAPYERYFEAEGFGLGAHRGTGGRSWDRTDLDPKAVVLGVEQDGDALGFPLPRVEAAGGVVTAMIGGERVVVFADEGIHAFADPGYDWRPTPAGFRADRPDGTGALYDGATGLPVDAPAAHTGESGGAAAEPLERVPSRRLFAFAWQDDHGADAFYEP
ncbi:DUF3179 domain-containing protein [Haloparvum sedimenti]|uniref:DUF3179 domain-containing protein n=1 Tax=Haloparvum sedimenti TaxID=1678448 RepID=UPI00071E8E7D|nr:DUF3179 domain-containing protein [Haloparvum sedimenti]